MAISPPTGSVEELTVSAPADDRVATTEELTAAFGQMVSSRRPRSTKGRRNRSKHTVSSTPTGKAPTRHRVEDLSKGYVEDGSAPTKEALLVTAKEKQREAFAKFGDAICLVPHSTRLHALLFTNPEKLADRDSKRNSISIENALKVIIEQLSEESGPMKQLDALNQKSIGMIENKTRELRERIQLLREEFSDQLPSIRPGSHLSKLLNSPIDELIQSTIVEDDQVYGRLQACRILLAQLKKGSKLHGALVHLRGRDENAEERVAKKIEEVEALRQRRLNAFGDGLQLVHTGTYLEMLMTQPIEDVAAYVAESDGVRDMDHALSILVNQLRLEGKLMGTLKELTDKARETDKRVGRIETANRGKAGGSKAAKRSKKPDGPKPRGKGPSIGKPNPQGPDDPKRNRRGHVGLNAKGEKAGTKGARRRGKNGGKK